MLPGKRIIDLSLPLAPGMRGVEIEPKYTFEEKGWNASTYHLYSHAGTHLDAPIHFAVNNRTVDNLPLTQCIGPAWVADASHVGPGDLIELADLADIPEKMESGDSVLIKTGWSHRLGEYEYYNAMPRVSEELALWCEAKSLPMLGVEQPAVADPHNLEEITLIHRILLRAGIVIVEGLANLESLLQPRVIFCAMPIKVMGGDGAQVRAFAIEDSPEAHTP